MARNLCGDYLAIYVSNVIWAHPVLIGVDGYLHIILGLSGSYTYM